MVAAEPCRRVHGLINLDGEVRTTALAEARRAFLPTVRRDLESLGSRGLVSSPE